MAHYSAALDEIWRLRRLLAYEAGVLEAHLGYKSFPKTRRAFAEQQVARMQDAARGHSDKEAVATHSLSTRHITQGLGMKQTLTCHAWETDRGKV